MNRKLNRIWAKMPTTARTLIISEPVMTHGAFCKSPLHREPRGVKIRYKLVQNGNAMRKLRIPCLRTNAIAADVNDNTGVADAAAQNWLALIDAGNYSELGRKLLRFFGAQSRNRVWENSMNTFRQPLGNLVSRKLKSAEHLTEMPGAPDGQYVLMQFETSFATRNPPLKPSRL